MQYLFIVTYGRTGSTALQMALNALPGYCIRGENGGVLNHFSNATKALRDARGNLKEAETSGKHPWFGFENIDVSELERSLARIFANRVLMPPAGTRVAGFKEVRYWNQPDDQFDAAMRFMMRHFDPKFVFLTRDPAQVAKSGWWPNQKDALAKIEMARNRIEAAHQAYPSFLIDHAEFVGNPEGIAPLCDWLGEDPSPGVEMLSERLTHMQREGLGGRGQKLTRQIGRLFRPTPS